MIIQRATIDYAAEILSLQKVAYLSEANLYGKRLHERKYRQARSKDEDNKY